MADMLKNPSKRQEFIMIYMTANLTVNVFWIEAGWPGKRSLRSRWTAFFITSALSITII